MSAFFIARVFFFLLFIGCYCSLRIAIFYVLSVIRHLSLNTPKFGLAIDRQPRQK